MAEARMQKRYKVGHCPACQTDLYVNAVIELDGSGHDSPPDPRQEGKVSLSGTITGAETIPHDCRKKVQR